MGTLKERRLALGLSQGQLAALCGVSLHTIWNWEQRRHSPVLAGYVRLLHVLDQLENETELEVLDVSMHS